MTKTYTVTGKLSDEKTVILDEALPVKKGQVRVIVQPLTSSAGDFMQKLTEIRKFLADSGYKNRTKAEIDADLEAERKTWNS